MEKKDAKLELAEGVLGTQSYPWGEVWDFFKHCIQILGILTVYVIPLQCFTQTIVG